MIPISGNINECDCPGTTPAIGVLIDDVIPSIDTTQCGTWATELFVVNRNGLSRLASSSTLTFILEE